MLIGLWLIGSLLFHAIVVESVKSGKLPLILPVPLSSLARLKTALLVLSGAVFLLVPLVRDRILSTKSIPFQIGRQTGYSPDVRKLMTASIAGFGMAESIGISGLAFFLLGGSPSDFYLFLLISLFCFSVYFPNYRRWERWMKARIITGPGKNNIYARSLCFTRSTAL